MFAVCSWAWIKRDRERGDGWRSQW